MRSRDVIALQISTQKDAAPELRHSHRLNTKTLMTRRGTGEEREEGGGRVC